MKRSVAILGPTPQFVRWAIAQPCDLREIDVENLPDHSFRQLRGLREYSVGAIENRVIENVCLHPTASVDSPEQALGFMASEILDPYGGEKSISEQCKGCPANALGESRSNIWAGCYGWLPAVGGFTFESAINQAGDSGQPAQQIPNTDEQVDLVELFERFDDAAFNSAFNQLFNSTNPRWYGVWQTQKLTPEHSAILLRLVNKILELNSKNVSNALVNLIQFRDALVRCVDNGLVLETELIPPGHSDGQTWTIFSHCPDCKKQMEDQAEQQRCSSCGRFGNPHGQRKSKVLGLRPYVQLEGVLGKEKAEELVSRYEKASPRKFR